MKVCNACGNTVADDVKFCPQCGAELKDTGTKVESSDVTEQADSGGAGIDDWKSSEGQTLICRQCQTPLQPTDEDWEKGYTICPACGTQRVLSEHKKIEGTVYHKIDNSEQLAGRLDLADRAWSAGNYAEALTYYTKALEDDPQCVFALYRKGLCSIEVNPTGIKEYKIYLEDASNLLDKQTAELSKRSEGMGEDDSEETYKDLEDCMKTMKTMGKEVYNFLLSLDSPADVQDVTFHTQRECEQMVGLWVTTANLYYISSVYVHDPEYKEHILYDGAIYIDKVRNARVSYAQTYYKHDRYVTDYINYQPSDSAMSFLSDTHKKMVDTYNSLSTRKEKEEQLKKEMNIIQENGKKLTAERDKIQRKLDQVTTDFWENNPEMKKKRNTRKLIPWCIAVFGVILLIISIFINWLGYGILAFVLTTALAIIFGIPVYKAFEDSVLSSEVKELKTSLEKAEEKVNEYKLTETNKQNEINKFEKEKTLTA